MVLITQNRVCCERKREGRRGEREGEGEGRRGEREGEGERERERERGKEREREAGREIGRESGASYLPTGYFKHIQILGKSLEAPEAGTHDTQPG